METRRFPNRGEAERHLVDQGFTFQGAPSRWRKQEGAMVIHAEVVSQNGGAVVIFREASEPRGK